MNFRALLLVAAAAAAVQANAINYSDANCQNQIGNEPVPTGCTGSSTNGVSTSFQFVCDSTGTKITQMVYMTSNCSGSGTAGVSFDINKCTPFAGSNSYVKFVGSCSNGKFSNSAASTSFSRLAVAGVAVAGAAILQA